MRTIRKFTSTPLQNVVKPIRKYTLLNKLNYEIISSDARREFIDVLSAKLK